MLSSQRNRLMSRAALERVFRCSTVGTSIALSVLAAGCSADVTRLDGPSFNLADNSGTAAAPRPSEPLGRRNAGGPIDNGSWPSSGPRDADQVTRSTLPPPPASSYPAASAQAQKFASLPPPASQPPSVVRPYAPAAAAAPVARQAPVQSASLTPPVRQPVATGETIEVTQGDSLYGLSKRHGVSLAALMEANGLTSPNLKPGQKLVLPLVSGAKKPKAREAVQSAAAMPAARTPAPAPAASAPMAAAAPVAAVPSDWSGSYTLKPGDSLYGVARSHKVAAAELQRVNGITDPTKVRPGAVLKVPGAGIVAAAPFAAPVAAAPAATLPTVAQVPVAQGAGTALSPKIIGSAAQAPAAEARVAALNDTATDAAPAAANTPQTKQVKTAAVVPAAAAAAISGKFRWPVKGKVISEFGKRADGTHNDGINVAVPAGTDVQAAEAGTVAYAGSELKGYGNLVLIRHENGWVSAYAHSDTVLVKRGDAVKRGQVIAKAGKTGTVDQPQVHFELRQGSKPVDPTPHMDKQ
jgi:murein DD-endopeptidase MepM/ murein hydrolase activator NlpD